MRLALAIALAGGMAIGGTTLSAPAFAKDKAEKQEKAEGNSKAFSEAYEPFLKIVNDPAGDYASAKAMIPTVQAAIQNDTDKNTLGNALIALGGKLKDTEVQKQGIQLALASGKADPAQVGLFHYSLGQWAYNAKNFAEARTQLQAAIQAGYTQGDPEALIAETYFGEGNNAAGLKYLGDLIAKRRAAGQQVPDNWYLRGLKVAYEGKLTQQANDYATMLVKQDPTAKNWTAALQVVNALNQFDPQSELDLLRLMRQTGALTQRAEYTQYIEAADPRRMANEVLAVLDDAVKAGVLQPTDTYYKEVKAIADTRAAADRKETPGLVDDARKAATGVTAQGTGDAFFSFGAYPQAADMYQVALDKGGLKDREMVLTRLGIAQAEQGSYDAARATLQKVTGTRAPIARMWLAWIDTKAAPAA
jgi:hypothetical protein